MKAAAIIVIILCLAAVAGLGYLYLSSNVTIAFEECIATDAVPQAEYFETLRRQISEKSFVGTLFSQAFPESPETCQFYTFTVRLQNRSFLPVDVIELQVTPMGDDVLQIGDTEAHSLPSGRSLNLSATVLTSKQMHNVRELTVTYYIWGLPFSYRLTTGR